MSCGRGWWAWLVGVAGGRVGVSNTGVSNTLMVDLESHNKNRARIAEKITL